MTFPICMPILKFQKGHGLKFQLMYWGPYQQDILMHRLQERLTVDFRFSDKSLM